MTSQLETQVLVVGAGSTGLAIARELSKYKVDVTVVEKNADFCFGEVKACAGLLYSYISLNNADSLVLKSAVTPDLPLSEVYHPDSLKAKLTIDGVSEFPQLAKDLDIRHRVGRTLSMGRDEDDFKVMSMTQELCKRMGIETRKLDNDGIREIEPHVSRDIPLGYVRENDAIRIYPWEYGIALGENARDNGVRMMLLTEVHAIKPLSDSFIVDTGNGQIRTRFIVNAAGPWADKIAEMAGVRDFDLIFSKSTQHVTDKHVGGLVNDIVTMVPRPGIGRMIGRTLSGNLLIGCASFEYPASAPEDTGVTRMEYIDQDLARAQTVIPEISKKNIITSFAGVRVFNNRDPENHLFEISQGNPNFINAVTRMPGMGLAPAMARYIAGLLADRGLELTEKPDFNPRRKRIPWVSELTEEDRSELIKRDSRYGHIVCRCEEVSEGEIVEAIRVGARTVAGIKFRTRAGMGRCQGGFCGPRVVEILARELDIPMTQITQKGGLSRVLQYRSKELLGVGG